MQKGAIKKGQNKEEHDKKMYKIQHFMEHVTLEPRIIQSHQMLGNSEWIKYAHILKTEFTTRCSDDCHTG